MRMRLRHDRAASGLVDEAVDGYRACSFLMSYTSYTCNGYKVLHKSSDLQDHEVENPPTNDVQGYDVAIVGGGMVGMALACSLG
ncbi:Putative ubiquinone biosynthesis monooxygenase [Ancistrocladus abbreviatus]